MTTTSRSGSPLTCLTEKLGGESQFKQFIETFCERALEDANLAMAFKGMDSEVLSGRMEHLIKMVFGYSYKSSMVDEKIRGGIVLRNYSIFQLGMNAMQLEKLQAQFEASMVDSLVDGNAYRRCKDRFDDLRKMIEVQSHGIHQSNIAFENDAARIMMARSGSSRRVISARTA